MLAFEDVLNLTDIILFVKFLKYQFWWEMILLEVGINFLCLLKGNKEVSSFKLTLSTSLKTV
jgi:hypothetical protein